MAARALVLSKKPTRKVERRGGSRFAQAAIKRQRLLPPVAHPDRSAAIHASILITSLLGGLLLVSCSRTHSSAPPAEEQSVKQRVADLEQRINGNAPPLNEAEARKQQEDDFAEIQSMGLVERAQRDFSTRHTNATVETWTIRYLMRTNTVWCDARYRLPGGRELWQQEFGYTRKTGTNWSLIWGVGREPGIRESIAEEVR